MEPGSALMRSTWVCSFASSRPGVRIHSMSADRCFETNFRDSRNSSDLRPDVGGSEAYRVPGPIGTRRLSTSACSVYRRSTVSFDECAFGEDGQPGLVLGTSNPEINEIGETVLVEQNVDGLTSRLTSPTLCAARAR